MATTVKFHELGAPEVLRLVEERADRPAPGELRVRIEAIGLNRAEALFRSGTYIEPVTAFPARLGLEAAGVVEALGAGVSSVRVGEPVSIIPAYSMNDYGVYAERAVVPASAVVARPDDVDAVTGAAVWMAHLTAYGALVEVGRMRPGDTVLLTAASSSVGLAAIQVAHRVGATPIATTRSQTKKQALLDAGASEVVVTGDEDLVARVRELTDGRGVELAFDAVAGPDVMRLAKVVAPGGLLIEYGALSGRPTPYPGFTLGMPALNMRTYTLPETTSDAERLRRASAFVSSGLRAETVRPTVDRCFNLAEIIDAHHYMETGSQVGKIVVTVDR